MKIYTKKGDAGQTGLYGGERVSKDHLRIRTYGTVDELNATLGIVLADHVVSPDLKKRLNRLQSELFQLGAELATPRSKDPKVLKMRLVDEAMVTQMEHEIDSMEAVLAPLTAFILPGGSVGSAQLHLSRTVSRRAERELVVLHREEPVRPEILQYMNRLSDYLFVCARFANHEAGIKDTPWEAPKV